MTNRLKYVILYIVKNNNETLKGGIKMKDYVKVEVRVSAGDFTLIKKKNGKEKYKSFGFFERPLNLHGYYRKVVTPDIVDKTIEEYKQDYYNSFDKYLSQYENKYIVKKRVLNFSVDIEKASEQSVKWCIENLTVSQMLDMGISLIKVD